LDSAALDLIAAGLSNQITRAIDGAYLANTTAKGPNGLLSIAYTGVETGASLTNLDPFVAARYAAKSHGSDLTSWIISPAQAEALSKLKSARGSNQSLIQFVEDGITVAGLPVIVSDHVDQHEVSEHPPRRTSSWWFARAPKSSGYRTSRRTVSGSVRYHVWASAS
jgi:HK97 family phage major capsid protein